MYPIAELFDAFGVGIVNTPVVALPSVNLPFDMFGSKSKTTKESIKTPAGFDKYIVSPSVLIEKLASNAEFKIDVK